MITIEFLLFQTVYLIIISHNNWTNKNFIRCQWTTMIEYIWTFIIIGPLWEESLFRHALPKLMPNYYNAYISGILFGLIHLSNIRVASWKDVIYQSIGATYIGYYLYNLDDFVSAIIVHMYHNALCIMTNYCLGYYYDKYCTDDNHSTNDQSLHDNFHEGFICKRSDDFHVGMNSKRSDGFSMGIRRKKLGKWIPKSDIKPDILERSNKLTKIMSKRNKFIDQTIYSSC